MVMSGPLARFRTCGYTRSYMSPSPKKAPWIARVIFPDIPQPHLQRKLFRQLVWAIAIGTLVAASVAGMLSWNS